MRENDARTELLLGPYPLSFRNEFLSFVMFYDVIDRNEVLQEAFKGGQVKHVGGIGETFRRIVMDFHEEAVYAGCGSGSCQVRNEFALAAGGSAHAARELYAVGGIENDRIAKASHDREGAHINDKVVVAEGCTAFGDSQVRVACFFHFSMTFFMSSGAMNWPFFTLTGTPVLAAP